MRSIKILQVLVLLIFLTSFAKAQACGPIFFRIFLKDLNGQIIKNAKIETFDKEFKKERFPFDKPILWSEEEQTYFGFQGLGGSAYGTGLRISADGFETFEKVINLPLGFTSFAITLKREGTNEIANSIQLTHFRGKFVNEYMAPNIPVAELEIIEESGKKYIAKSDKYGNFAADLPIGTYTIRALKNGFEVLKIINFQIEDTNTIYLDYPIKIPVCNDCKWDEREKVILDYQIIKRKNNK